MDKINEQYFHEHSDKFDGLKDCLDVGSRNVNGTFYPFIRAGGRMSYFGIDLQHCQPGEKIDGRDTVDMVADITEDGVVEKIGKTFDLIVCANTLEHVYDPVKAIKNMVSMLRPNGYLLIITPLIWPLHDWPYDIQRLNPDFYVETAKRNNLTIVEDSFYLTLRDKPGRYSVKELPTIGGLCTGLKRFCYRVLCKFFPEFSFTPTYTYINLIYKRD